MALSRTTLTSTVSADGHGTGPLTSSSFTPPDNSLIVVVGGGMATAGVADPSANLTMAGGSLTFTRRVFTGVGTDFGIGVAIWTAPVATGASMTLTLDCGATNLQIGLISAVAYTGYDTANPVGGSGTGSQGAGASDGAQSQNLNATPAIDSEVIAAIMLDKESAGCTPGAAYTEIHDLQIGATGGLETEVRGNSTSTTFDWVDTHTGTGSIFKIAYVGLEIKAGAGADAPPAPRTVWPALTEKLGGPWPRPQTQVSESSADTAPVNPDLVPQSSTRLAWVARRLRRPAQVVRVVPALPDMAPANTSTRRIRPKRGARSAQPPPVQALPPVDVEIGQRRREAATVRSQSAQRVPDQVVTPPATPDFVSGAPTRRLRWAQRRSESAQPVLTQVAPPTNPPIVFLARARRVLLGRRSSDVAEAPLETALPPASPRQERRLLRARRSESTAPTAEQPAASVPLERRRIVVRRTSGRSATPTPAQVAAPQNPLLVALVHERVRRVFRRNVGHTASPVPAQQAAPQNPPFVFGIRRRVQPALRRGFGQVSSPITQATDFVVSSPGRVRRLLRRRSGRVVSPTPTQQAAPQNPAFVPVTRGHVRPALRRGDGRTASPVTTQIAAPQNPAFVPVIPKRVRRIAARAGHTAEAPVEPTQLVQAVASPLRRLVRQIRRRLAQIFPAIGVFPPPDVDVSTGPDRYSATTGADRYSATTGVDRYEASSGVRGFDATTGTDRYSGDVAR